VAVCKALRLSKGSHSDSVRPSAHERFFAAAAAGMKHSVLNGRERTSGCFTAAFFQTQHASFSEVRCGGRTAVGGDNTHVTVTGRSDSATHITVTGHSDGVTYVTVTGRSDGVTHVTVTGRSECYARN